LRATGGGDGGRAATIQSVLQAEPALIATLTLPGATTAECAVKLNAQLQALASHAENASAGEQHLTAATQLQQLSACLEGLQGSVAFGTLLSDAVLAQLNGLTERMEETHASENGLAAEYAAEISVLLEMLQVNNESAANHNTATRETDVVARAEGTLVQYLLHLRADFQDRMPGVTASAPAGLSDFLAPMRFLHALMSVYHLAPESVVKAVIRSVNEDFNKELHGLTQRLLAAFPGGGTQSVEAVAHVDVLATALVVLVMRGFASFDAGALVDTVVRFTLDHAAVASPFAEAVRIVLECYSGFSRATRLVDPLNSLAAELYTRVLEASAFIQRLDLVHPGAKKDVEAAVQAYSALCALRDLLTRYLERPAYESIVRGIVQVRDVALTAAREHMQKADTAAQQGRFTECETILLLVQRLEVGFSGESQTHFPPPAGLSADTVRGEIDAYVSRVTRTYDAAFENVQVAFDCAPPLTQGEDGVGPPLAERTGGRAAADISSATHKLCAVLAATPPKDVLESLEGAANGRNLCSATAKTFRERLAGQVNGVLSLCTDVKYTYDLRLDVLSQLQEAARYLSADMCSGLPSTLAAIQEHFKSVTERCAADNQAVGPLIDYLAENITGGEYTYCGVYSAAIAARINSAAITWNTMHPGEALNHLVEMWSDWTRYFELHSRILGNPKFTAVATGASTSSNRALALAAEIGRQIFGLLDRGPALAAAAPDVFPQLEGYVDLAIQLYNIFLVASAPEALGTLLSNLSGALDPAGRLIFALETFFKNVAQLLIDHADQVSRAVAADDVDFCAVSVLLDKFAQSTAVYAKLMRFVTRTTLRAVDKVRTECRPYRTVITEVEAALRRAIVRVKVNLLTGAALQRNFSERRTVYFRDLASAYKRVLLSIVLQPHLSCTAALVGDCTQHLSSQVTAVRAHLTETVLSHEDTVSTECCQSYNFWLDNLTALRAAFSEHTALAQEVDDAVVSVQRRLSVVLANMVNHAENELVERVLALRLVAIKALAERLRSVKTEIEAQLIQLLYTIKSRDAQSIVRLAVLLESVADPADPSVREHAQMLLRNYRIFDGYQLSLFNTRVTRYAFDQVLGRTRAQLLREPGEGGPNRRAKTVEDTISVEEVLRQYRKFNDKYRTLVRRGLTQIDKAKERCKIAVQEISRRSCISFTVKVRELMVQLFLYWTLSNSTHYFDNVDGQAAGQAADDFHWMYLKQPHAGQIISIAACSASTVASHRSRSCRTTSCRSALGRASQ
jgi:hypothetical protein